MNQISVTLKYINNVIRREIGIITFPYFDNTTLQDLYEHLYGMLAHNGIVITRDSNKFIILNISEHAPASKISSLSMESITVLYSDVTPPHSARRIEKFDEAFLKTGARFEFYTSEKCHPYFPHVNAIFSGKRDAKKMVRIAIESGAVIDHLPKGLSTHTIKPAVEYVKENKEYFLNEWYAFVGF